jgi:hypothetical protein
MGFSGSLIKALASRQQTSQIFYKLINIAAIGSESLVGEKPKPVRRTVSQTGGMLKPASVVLPGLYGLHE